MLKLHGRDQTLAMQKSENVELRRNHLAKLNEEKRGKIKQHPSK
jgi:hypothetical protein